MLALEIHINGKKHCTAGHTGPGAVTALLCCVSRLREQDGLPEEQITLHISGLDSHRREHVSWLDRSDLAVGDEVVLRVIEASSCDAPLADSRRAHDEQRHKDYVLRMAKQFGWKVETTS